MNLLSIQGQIVTCGSLIYSGLHRVSLQSTLRKGRFIPYN